jgi:3-deoxy-D-manno-octulosonate 8-phosphate phosphatase KdsC-like HAD superfamily phosphatase
MSKIKLVVSEVEGVITTGRQPIDELGNTVFKDYYFPDFEAINMIKKKFCPVVFLSSDNSVNYNMFNRRNIPFFWAKKDKRPLLSQILRRYNVSADDVVYIGSKLSDIPCMNMIPNSFTTNELISHINGTAGYDYDNLVTPPGEGVLTEIYLRLKSGDL